MAKIYSSFSNPSGDLGELQQEFAGLFNFFNSNSIKKKVDFEFGMNASVDALTSKIIAGQKEIRLFHFSGHSGGSGLDFPQSQFTAEQVSNFFNSISADDSKIDCVFLNGCENEKIVGMLSGVPVIIGTTSRIQDKTAGKFTLDFFTALIKGECTYRQAFNDAKSAIRETGETDDRIRGESGTITFTMPATISNYFFKSNDDRIADSKFPLKPKKTNWTKYLFFFLLATALLLGYFCRDQLSLIINGYTCSQTCFSNNKTCNFVLGDFAKSPQVLDVSQRLINDLELYPEIGKHISIINLPEFKSVINKQRVSKDSFPSYCNYDYNVIGNFNQKAAIFRIFPPAHNSLLDSTYTYDVKSMGRKDTANAELTSENIEQILLFEMCATCALRKSNMSDLPKSALTIKDVIDKNGSLDYQRLYNRLADFYLINKDTAKAVLALNEVIKSGVNDFALMAIERKISLYISSHKIRNIFATQSDLITAYQARTDDRTRYEIRGNINDYTRGENTVRLDRARLVLQYRDSDLKDFKRTALQDFLYLQSIHFNGEDFTTEISLLREPVPELPSDSITQPVTPTFSKIQIDGRVVNETGESLSGATVTFGKRQISTNADGYFNFGQFDIPDVLRKTLFISDQGYNDKKITMTGESLGKIVLIPLPTKEKITFMAVRTEDEQFKKIFSYLLHEGYLLNEQSSMNLVETPASFPNASTILYYTEEKKPAAEILAKKLRAWTGESYEILPGNTFPFISKSKSVIKNELTIHMVGRVKMFHLQGFVFVKEKPLPDANVLLDDKSILTDNKGHFDFGDLPETRVMGMPLTISHQGFKTKSIQINEENIMRIVLETFKGKLLNNFKLTDTVKVN